MTDYNQFSKFYDAIMGDRTKTVERIELLIQKYNPAAKSLLEVACGTGALLKMLASKYAVSGLDLSAGMLEVARKEVPEAHLYEQSMTSFVIPQKFDVIVCLFDSINHLLTLEEWGKALIQAREHLSENGVFIFDMNAEKKLDRVLNESAGVREFDGHVMIMDVSDVGEKIVNWNVKIFEHTKDDQYRLHEENIREVTFPTDDIIKLTNSIFSFVEFVDLDEVHPKKNGERLHFICKK